MGIGLSTDAKLLLIPFSVAEASICPFGTTDDIWDCLAGTISEPKLAIKKS